MTLREKQSAFALAYAKLILFAFDKGFAVTLADGAIDPVRKYRNRATGKLEVGEDAVHMKSSLHYMRLAADINLFRDGKLIADGGDPAWTLLGAHWKTLHADAAWGGDFPSVDSNHFSLRHGGRA